MAYRGVFRGAGIGLPGLGRDPGGRLGPWIDDDDERRDWLDCEFEVRSHTPGTTLRLEAADGSRVTVSLRALPDAADGTPRTRVEVVHSGLLRADDLEETKAFWRAALTALASLVS